MKSKIYYFPRQRTDLFMREHGILKRYFFWPFSKEKKKKIILRSGALQPEEVKKRIQEIGIGKQVEIIRIGFNGTIDDIPIIVELIDISDYSFTGRIINLERQMIESVTDKMIYAKKGGGVIEFYFNDGDIKEINVSKDKELLEQERDISSLKEILSALDKGDQILVAYFDQKHKGTINTEGSLLEKDENNEVFILQIEKINKIDLEKKIQKRFNIKEDLVIDIEMV
jgi:hypothetical protein